MLRHLGGGTIWRRRFGGWSRLRTGRWYGSTSVTERSANGKHWNAANWQHRSTSNRQHNPAADWVHAAFGAARIESDEPEWRRGGTFYDEPAFH